MFNGLLTPCKKCSKEKCGLWVTITWENETTKEKKDESECAILGIYKFMARLEGRAIATQKSSEEARNFVTEINGNMQAMTQGLSKGLKQYFMILDNEINSRIEEIVDNKLNLIEG